MTKGHFVVDEPALREFRGLTPASRIDELKKAPVGKKPRIITIANESQGVTQSDIVNNKQHLVFRKVFAEEGDL